MPNRSPRARSLRALWVAGVLFAATSCGDSPLPAGDGGRLDASSEDARVEPRRDGGRSRPGCGDGEQALDEACDDGNTVGGDGCSADCQSDESCGNGFLDAELGEFCDDGNTEDGDTCRGDCLSDYRCGNDLVDTMESGASADELCDDGNTESGDGCSADCQSDERCGNGVVDFAAGEMCDDGNTSDGDACSADCSMSALCGNGSLDGI